MVIVPLVGVDFCLFSEAAYFSRLELMSWNLLRASSESDAETDTLELVTVGVEVSDTLVDVTSTSTMM